MNPRYMRVGLAVAVGGRVGDDVVAVAVGASWYVGGREIERSLKLLTLEVATGDPILGLRASLPMTLPSTLYPLPHLKVSVNNSRCLRSGGSFRHGPAPYLFLSRSKVILWREEGEGEL